MANYISFGSCIFGGVLRKNHAFIHQVKTYGSNTAHCLTEHNQSFLLVKKSYYYLSRNPLIN